MVIEKQMRGRCSGGGQKPSKVSSSKWRLPDSGSLVTGLLSPICEDYICGCGTETGLYGSGTQWQSLISSLIFYTGRSSRCQLALQWDFLQIYGLIQYTLFWYIMQKWTQVFRFSGLFDSLFQWISGLPIFLVYWFFCFFIFSGFCGLLVSLVFWFIVFL